MQSQRRMHGSCVSKDGQAVLLVGPPGSGKSDLVFRLLAKGFELVADDQVDIDACIATPPAALAGLLEVRNITLGWF
jgi:HPr kinase/phosphorylase